MYNLFAISVVFILVHISCGLCFGYDARSNSLAGGEFFPYNVASFSDYKEKIFQIDMRRLYVGISDNTEIGLDCILPSRKTGSFVFKGSFVSDGALTQYEISAGYAKGKKFLGQFYFSFGGNFKIAGLGYDKSKFHNVDLQDPLFRGDLKKADFGLDLGFMLKYKSIETGFTVINVRSPSLSLVGSPEGKLLKEYLLNISFPLSHRLTVLSTYEHPEQLSPLYGLGLEYILFSDYLLRLGIRMEKNRFNQLSVGFGIPLKRFNFDYGFNYPITDALSRTATSTHNLSISYKLPLPPPLPDIALHSLILKDKQVVEGETLRYSFVVSNEGQERASEFPVVVWLEPDSSSFNTNYIVDGGLGINEERSFSGWFIVQSPGWYHIMVLADPSGLIREKKKNNNLIADTLLVSSEIQGKLELAFEKLELEELTYLVEEQPIIPVVFFDKDKSDINARFESMLQTIASRMKINKNIRLKLFGYVDTLSDSPNWKEKNLHIMRASKVSEFLAGLGVEPSRIEVVEQDYLPYAIRAGKRFESIPETQKPLINEENRRVEIVATLQGFDDTLKIYKGAFPQNETIERYKRFLAENPDIILIIKGYGSEDAPYEKLSELDKIRKDILQGDTIFTERVALLLSSYGNNDTVYLFPSADATLY
ncbi:MAG: type IX secretion system membrane protein PorP/SprF, partial [bacterium]